MEEWKNVQIPVSLVGIEFALENEFLSAQNFPQASLDVGGENLPPIREIQVFQNKVLHHHWYTVLPKGSIATFSRRNTAHTLNRSRKQPQFLLIEINCLSGKYTENFSRCFF